MAFIKSIASWSSQVPLIHVWPTSGQTQNGLNSESGIVTRPDYIIEIAVLEPTIGGFNSRPFLLKIEP